MGLVPTLLLWQLGTIIDRAAPIFLLSGLIAVGLCLIVYHILHRWHHGTLLTILSLGLPLMYYIFVAASHPVFLPLFYGVIVLVVLAGVLGALVSGKWSWQGLAINIAFFFSVLLLVIFIGSRFELVYVEAGLLAAGAFGITRLCQMNLVSWMALVPRWIYKGMEKIWY